MLQLLVMRCEVLGFIRTIIFVSLGLSIAACNDGGYKFNKSKSGVYELDMRQEMKLYGPERGQVSYEKKAWRLDIPKTYIRSYYGANGKPRYSFESKVKNNYSMTLFAVIDEENSTLKPDPEVISGKHIEDRVAITIGNGIANEKTQAALHSKEQCVTRSFLFGEIQGSERSGNVNRCEEGKALCAVHMYMDAWPVNISLPRKHFVTDPQPVCEMVRDFLEDMTINRDSLTENGDVQIRRLDER